MQKIKSFFSDRRLLPLWLTLLSALFYYSSYSFQYEYWDWVDLPLVGLYAAISGVCFGLAVLLCVSCFCQKKKLLAFLAGAAGYEAILWTVLTLVNVEGQYNHRAIYLAFAILFALHAAVCLIALWKNAQGKHRIVGRCAGVLLALVFTFLAVQPALPTAEAFRRSFDFTDRLQYAPIAADALRVKPDEVNTARAWFESHVLFHGSGTPAYDFTVGEERFSEHTADWRFTVSAPAENGRGGEAYTVTGLHPGGLELTVEGTFYEAFATFEYTVYLKNGGSADSPVISDFCALTGPLGDLHLGKADIYCSVGSHDAAEDFTPMKIKNPAKPHTFTGVGGRPSDAWMPFFNLCGETCGLILGVGWTGQWQTELRVKDGTADITVKQQSFEAYLTPGETVRTPLTSLTVYEEPNPVKGWNVFRGWLLECVYPENLPRLLNDLDVLFVSHTRTAEEIKNDVAEYDPALLKTVDNFWMDAGWYEGCKETWSDGNGYWTAAPERFPGGIGEISDLAASHGCGLVLWYEPERLVHGSRLYEAGQQHPQWIIDTEPAAEDNDRILWNLADDGARRYLADYIAKTLKDNGVAIYRQDFNIEPLEKWEYADANYYGGRTGICENHYVTGLYAYLDTLLEAVPGLVIDNCASGGRRLDLEMTRRSIPLWRSDYNCVYRPDTINATQAHTFGLSFWQPLNGVNIYYFSEYGARSSIYYGNLFTYDSCLTEYFGALDAERELMKKNFFPIFCGGVDLRKITAMQYGDETAGEVLIYKHEKAPDGVYDVAFSGLAPAAEYAVYSVDSPENVIFMTGEELMCKKYDLILPEGEKALIVKYEARR